MPDQIIGAMALPFAAFMAAFLVPIALAFVVAGLVALATGRGPKPLAIGVLVAAGAILATIFVWSYGSGRVGDLRNTIEAGAVTNFKMFLPYGVGVAILLALWLGIPMMLKRKTN
jgi:hypothetical protein